MSSSSSEKPAQSTSGFPTSGQRHIQVDDGNPPDLDVLVVDDDEAYRLLIGTILSGRGYRVHAAGSCQEAETFLQNRAELPPLVVTDWNLPDGEGIDLMRRLKRDIRWRYLPVILCTGRSSPAEIQRGIDAGAFFYVTKPIDGRVLTTAVASAARSYDPVLRRMAREVHDTSEVLPHIRELRMEFRRVDEAVNVARWASRFFPDPDGARLGLQELIYNAIEHGNLGINYDEKSKLLQAPGQFHDEVQRRLEADEYRHRIVELQISAEAHYVEATISDEGEGFDFKKYLNLTPDRALDMHGKGIAIANNVVFDEMEYQGPGNVVRARMYRNTSETAGSENKIRPSPIGAGSVN